MLYGKDGMDLAVAAALRSRIGGKPLTAGVAGVVLALVAGCGRPGEGATRPSFTVVTYNVNFGMPSAEEAVRALAEIDADIVCLQETTPEWERLLRGRLGGRYPHVQFRHWPGAGGQAVLARRPFRSVSWRKPTAGWFPGWIVRADTPAGEVQVLNVHLRPSLAEGGRVSLGAYLDTPQVRRQEIRELVAGLDANLPALVVGDFNEGDRATAVGWLRGQGFADALGQFDPHANTWRWRTSLLALRERFDHILHSPHVRCLDARVAKRGASDHFPVVARFQAAEDP
jgi:endonuclease/exonuclease/phosphatase family metal-dependent hydrolase